MLARVDFDEQVSGRQPDERGVRPDLVVRLPGGKQPRRRREGPAGGVPRREADEVGAAERERLLRRTPGRCAGTSTRSPPGTTGRRSRRRRRWSSASSRATRSWPRRVAADPGLLEHAMSRRVVLASPGTLLALLRTVAFTWQQDALAGNARQLFERGQRALLPAGHPGHARARSWAHAAPGGRGLQRAGRHAGARVLVTARRMHDLGPGRRPSCPRCRRSSRHPAPADRGRAAGGLDADVARPQLDSTARPSWPRRRPGRAAHGLAARAPDVRALVRPAGSAQRLGSTPGVVPDLVASTPAALRSRRSSTGRENSRTPAAETTACTSP